MEILVESLEGINEGISGENPNRISEKFPGVILDRILEEPLKESQKKS